MKKIILLISIIFVIVPLAGCEVKNVSEDGNEYISSQINLPKNENNAKEESIKDTIGNSSNEVKTQVVLNVPFADQAPNKNWGDPYQEACEETSIIMANAFIKNNGTEDLDKSYINEQIIEMVSWQETNMGGHFDLDAQSTLELFQKFYNYSGGQVVVISSADDIKQYLSDGKIIIAPTSGRKLKNPYFTPPGPVYHMLVIKGYDGNNFITNDPGVWQGKNFQYPSDNLFLSIQDLPPEALGKTGYIKSHPDIMGNSSKRVIVIAKNY